MIPSNNLGGPWKLGTMRSSNFRKSKIACNIHCVEKKVQNPLTLAGPYSISNCMVGGMGKLKLKVSDHLRRFKFSSARAAQSFLTHNTGRPWTADPGLWDSKYSARQKQECNPLQSPWKFNAGRYCVANKIFAKTLFSTLKYQPKQAHSIVDVNWLLSSILRTLFSRICITLHEVSFETLLYCRNQSRDSTI